MNTISIETALGYLKAGLSCLPATREKKHPACGAWKKYAVELPLEIEVESWFANKHDAICIVTGSVSGNLECMDFDNHGELFGPWMEKIDRRQLEACPRRAGRKTRHFAPRPRRGGFRPFWAESRPPARNSSNVPAMSSQEEATSGLISRRPDGP